MIEYSHEVDIPVVMDETLAVANKDLSVRGFSEKEYLGEVEVSFLHDASQLWSLAFTYLYLFPASCNDATIR